MRSIAHWWLLQAVFLRLELHLLYIYKQLYIIGMTRIIFILLFLVLSFYVNRRFIYKLSLLTSEVNIAL